MKKRSKVMAAAIAMMALSTAASITGTVAWFTANNIVSASGMSIKAEAEEGIVIATELTSYADSDWGTSATAAHNGNNLGFIPTSTSDATNWYHGNATNVDNYASSNVAAVTVTAPTRVSGNGAGTATVNGVSRNIYLLNEFKIQAATPSDMSGQNLFINSLTATDSSTDAKTIKLNKSLRVLFKLDSTVLVYCPLLGSNFTGRGNAASATGTVVADTDKLISNGTIPGYTSAGTNAKTLYVYAYFEGEDDNCKSSNIGDINSISIEFELKNLPQA